MTLNQPLYAVVDENGRIVGDGECGCPAIRREDFKTQEVLDMSAEIGCLLRVVRVRIVEEK